MEHCQRSRLAPESASPMTAKIQPRPFSEPQADQHQQHLPDHDFSQVNLFAHDPGPRSRPNLIQAKLTIGQRKDPYEQEADRVAEQVMNMAPPTLPNVQRQTEEDEAEGIQPKSLVETITPLVQRQEVLEGEEPIQAKCEACEQEEKLQRSSNGTEQAQPDLESRLNASKGGGSPLPEDVRSFMEPRFKADFSQVRVHTGSDAVQMNQELGAQAFAHKQDVYFGAGKVPGKNALTAHELTHIVQQSSSDLRLDLKEGEQTANLTQKIIRALNTPDPIAGVGDYVTAYNLLNGLSMPEMLRVLNELARQSMLDVLINGAGQAQGVNMPRISAAIALVRFANVDAASIRQTELESFANNAQSLPIDQQQDMLNFVSSVRQISAATREGLVAMMASELSGATPGGGLSPAVAQGMTGPVGPGPWNPPGNQPIPFYIGNEAHIAIAASYTAAHPGDPVFTNFIPLSSILQQATTFGLSPNAGALSASDLALKPDILNLAPTRRHLYEIKPTSLQGTARTEAQMYVGLLATAGVPVTLGPVGEPGTNGAIPAPGGVYLFETPEAGVIVYQYRRQRVVEETAPVVEGEPARERRWRLAPLSPQQQAVVATTTVMGTMLIIMMILLSPVGV